MRALRSPLTLTDEDLWQSRLLLRLPRCMTAGDDAAHLRQFVSSAASELAARAQHTLILPRQGRPRQVSVLSLAAGNKRGQQAGAAQASLLSPSAAT